MATIGLTGTTGIGITKQIGQVVGAGLHNTHHVGLCGREDFQHAKILPNYCCA
jgi:hypothetical protein